MRNIWYFSYVVASLTFLTLTYVEWQIPGFVSSVFPIYIALFIALACGIGALVGVGSSTNPGRRHQVLALAIGLVLSILIVRSGEVFGAFSFILAIAVLFLPVLLLKGVADDKK